MTTALNAARRTADLAAVADGGTVDVVVIGGGVTGAGIALDAASRHLGIGTDELLYARVDLIGGGTDPLLLELELIEPSLGWRQLDETTRALQQRTFALAVESACERLGLGPLSHRRP